jgi:hypothetical protein
LTAEEMTAVGREYRAGADTLRNMDRDFRGDPELQRRVQELNDAMRKFDPAHFRGNPEELERIRATILDGWRQVELELSRKLDGAGGLRLPAHEEIADSYRKEVEQYYRSLAQRQKK